MANKDLDERTAARAERHLGVVQHTKAMEARHRRELARFRLEEADGKAPWRNQHNPLGGPEPAVGPVEQVHGEARDFGGRTPIIGSARRCVDVVDLLLKRGTITAAEAEAGRSFQADFRAAGLDGLRAASLLRSPGGAARGPERWIEAGSNLDHAVAALGGPGSPLTLVAWEVLGCGRSMTEVSSGPRLRSGWALNKHVVKTLLILALVALSMTYGLARGEKGPLTRTR